MAFAVVQSNAATAQGGGSTSFTFAITTPLTTGNNVLACLAYTSNGIVVTSVVDNLGNAFSLDKRVTLSSRVAEIWRSTGVVGGASTLTITFNGGKSGVGITGIEISTAVGQTLAVSQQNSASSTPAVSSFPHGSITTLGVELVISVGRIGSAVITISPPAGYTQRSGNTGVNSSYVMSRITAGVEVTNPTPTSAGSTGYAGLTISYSEIPDTSGLRVSQMPKQVYYSEPAEARVTQMIRTVFYTFSCEPGPVPPTGEPGCPATVPLLPVTPPSGCPDEV